MQYSGKERRPHLLPTSTLYGDSLVSILEDDHSNLGTGLALRASHPMHTLGIIWNCLVLQGERFVGFGVALVEETSRTYGLPQPSMGPGVGCPSGRNDGLNYCN
jgi:hypothetical protein